MDWMTLFGGGAVFATLVGLAVWMVKKSTKRENDTTDKFIKHMETEAISNRETAAATVDAIREIAHSVTKHTEANKEATTQIVRRLDDHQEDLKEIKKTLADFKSAKKEGGS